MIFNTQLYGIKYSYLILIFFIAIQDTDDSLIRSFLPYQSRYGNKVNKRTIDKTPEL